LRQQVILSKAKDLVALLIEIPRFSRDDSSHRISLFTPPAVRRAGRNDMLLRLFTKPSRLHICGLLDR
jgi:hypothetical protein